MDVEKVAELVVTVGLRAGGQALVRLVLTEDGIWLVYMESCHAIILLLLLYQ